MGGARAEAGEGSVADETKATAATPQLELRRYQLRFGPMEARYGEYAKNVLIPALNRAGIKPVGAFTVLVGPGSPCLYLLLSHPDAASVASISARLPADAEYMKAAATFRALPASDPLYAGREASVLVPFATTPAVEVPTGPLAVPGRIFELRTYASHSEAAGAKKIEMFEKGGEIEIFRRVGLNPVFFARNLVGPLLPALTYMVVYSDMAARDKAWATFREDPEWVKLRSAPGFSNAEILTRIDSVLLRPTDYSQI
jgi:hypothetical protein